MAEQEIEEQEIEEQELTFPAGTSLGDFSLVNDTKVLVKGGSLNSDSCVFNATEASTTIRIPVGTDIRYNSMGFTAKIIVTDSWPINGSFGVI